MPLLAGAHDFTWMQCRSGQHLLHASLISNGPQVAGLACIATKRLMQDLHSAVCMSKQHSASADLQKQVLASANACVHTTAQLCADLRRDPQKVCELPQPRQPKATDLHAEACCNEHDMGVLDKPVLEPQTIDASCQRLRSSEASILRTEKVCLPPAC